MSRYDIELKGKTLELGCGERPIAPYGDLLDKRDLPLRISAGVIVCDLENPPYPLENNKYDTVLGIYVLEHISWPKYKSGAIQKELFRIMKPGGKGIFTIPNTLAQIDHIIHCDKHAPISFEHIETLFGSQDYPENSHKMGFDISKFIYDLFEPYGFKINIIAPMPDIYVENRCIYPTCETDMLLEITKEKGTAPPKTKECLNLGSFTVMIKNNPEEHWTNIDIIDDERTRGKARREGYEFLAYDIRKKLPFPLNSIDMINESHLIEHLTRDEGLKHLRDCFSILKKDGMLRIGTPDLNKFIDAYNKQNMKLFDKDQPDVYKKQPPAEKFWRIVTSGPPELLGTPQWEGHKTIYTPEDLTNILKDIGFGLVKTDVYDKRYDMFPDESFYLYAKKLEQDTIESKNVIIKNNKPYYIREVKI